MGQAIKILVVEDEMIIAANISLQLTEMGHEVLGIIPNGMDAIHQVQNKRPDLVLIDIQLKGPLDGIETALKMQECYKDLAVIYLTANADEDNFNRAKLTNPYAFISKPFKKLDLQRSIELSILKIKSSTDPESTDAEIANSDYVLEDFLFLRHLECMKKVAIKSILFIEADRNYCRVFTPKKEYLLVTTLKDMEKSLPQKQFFRLHRSYIINLSRIDEIAGTHVVILKKVIPMAKSMRKELLKRLQTV